jgi:hypothetical protein
LKHRRLRHRCKDGICAEFDYDIEGKLIIEDIQRDDFQDRVAGLN